MFHDTNFNRLMISFTGMLTNPSDFLSGSTEQKQWSQVTTFLSTVTAEIIVFTGTPYLDTRF